MSNGGTILLENYSESVINTVSSLKEITPFNVIRNSVDSADIKGSNAKDYIYNGDEVFGGIDTLVLGSLSIRSSVKNDDGSIILNISNGGSILLTNYFDSRINTVSSLADSTQINIIKDYNAGGKTADLNAGNYIVNEGGANISVSGGTKKDRIFNDYYSTNVTINGDDSDNYLIGGRGKDCLTGGAGNDTLWGGKKNDTLLGGDGDDTFIFQAGGGKDTILDYASGELLQILDKRGEEGTFKKATFKDNTLTLAIQGGGKIIFDGVNNSAAFNINGESYHVEGNTLTK